MALLGDQLGDRGRTPKHRRSHVPSWDGLARRLSEAFGNESSRIGVAAYFRRSASSRSSFARPGSITTFPAPCRKFGGEKFPVGLRAKLDHLLAPPVELEDAMPGSAMFVIADQGDAKHGGQRWFWGGGACARPAYKIAACLLLTFAEQCIGNDALGRHYIVEDRRPTFFISRHSRVRRSE